MKIQHTLQTLYEEIDGHYYSGDAAWEYIQRKTGIDLQRILEELAEERMENDDQ